MNFDKKFEEAVSAGFGGIWVKSLEHEDCVRAVTEVCQKYDWKLALYDVANGFKMVGETVSATTDPSFLGSMATVLKMAKEVTESGDDPDFRCIVAIRNLHFALNNDAVNIQALQHIIEEGAGYGLHVVGMTPSTTKLPMELEKHFYSIEHNLPTIDELYDLAKEMDEKLNLPDKGSEEAAVLLGNVSGLGRMEAMGAFGLSIARHGKLKPDALWDTKTQTIEKSGLLKIHRPEFGFDMICGLEHVKSFLMEGLQSPNKSERVRLKSVLLLGVPGTGKTFIAQCLGKEINWPAIEVEVGALKGSLVGQTEANTRIATDTLDATAPSIAIFDEIEKGVSTNSIDGGASMGQLGHLLSWQNDRKSDVLCVFTSNDISKLPPEFTRAGRVDGIFFMDLPGREAKDQVWDTYTKLFELGDVERPGDENWTPAEIMSCCRLASLFDRPLKDAASQVVSVYATNKEGVEKLRTWAEGRCLSADYRGVYHRGGMKEAIGAPGTKPRRKVRKQAVPAGG